jgi:hypothetical protein
MLSYYYDSIYVTETSVPRSYLDARKVDAILVPVRQHVHRLIPIGLVDCGQCHNIPFLGARVDAKSIPVRASGAGRGHASPRWVATLAQADGVIGSLPLAGAFVHTRFAAPKTSVSVCVCVCVCSRSCTYRSLSKFENDTHFPHA